MRPAIWLAVALIGSAGADSSATRQAPSYSAASVVNAASNQADAYAPNTFVSIYGTNLAWTTRSLSSSDITGNKLPTVLPGTGVRVWVGGIPALMYYVSPSQINVLLPKLLGPGDTHVRVQVDSTYGPDIPITITEVAPAFFQLDAHTIIAAHADGSVVTADSPAKPGEVVVLYATGLGETIPDPGYDEIPSRPAVLADMTHFSVTLDGAKVDRWRISYAGVAPGFAGLYQINVQVPDDVGPDPEIRIALRSVSSPAGLKLPVAR